MKKVLLLFSLSLAICSTAQTKTIAHKRHSASLNSFSKSLHLEGRNGGDSNFGNTPWMEIKLSESILKTVKYVDDTTILFIHELHSLDTIYDQTNDPFFVIDTVNLFNQFDNTMDNEKVKKIVRDQMSLDNTETDTVVFENFENRATMQERNSTNEKRLAQPTKIKKNQGGFPFFKTTLFSLIIVLSIFITLDFKK